VRAAADSMIPLISAVGHETDFTLIDFASDRRAPTPTAAAEMAVPVRADLIAELMSKARRALACWQRAQDHRRTELRAASRALPNAEELLAGPRQRLDSCVERLPRALRANAQIHHTQFSRVSGRLSPQLLRTNVERRRERYNAFALRLRTGLAANAQAIKLRITNQKQRTADFGERSTLAIGNLIAKRKARTEQAGQLLSAFSYRGVLSRGFALVRDGAGHPLRSAMAVSAGARLDIEFADGRIGAVADGSTPMERAQPASPLKQPTTKPRKSGTGSGGGPGQGSLFG
jgi:exodeoxyribonuclease VII large subunit